MRGHHWFHGVGEKYLQAVAQAADATPLLIRPWAEELDIDALP